MGGINTGGPFQYYRYTPSIPAGITFIILFSVTTGLHTYQLARTRTWILLPLVLGGYCESIGYIGRVLSSKEAPNFTMGPYLMQSLLTLLAPALFAASIYMCLSRIILATDGQALSLIKPVRLTALFVSADVIGLATQGGGAGLMTAGSLANFYAGEKVVITGLAVLVASFGLFVLVAFTFDFRIRKAPTTRSCSSQLNWRINLQALYTGSVLILVRSIFRLVEYSQGNAGWLIRHEWTFYVFDSALMFGVLILFNVLHPSHVNALLHGGKYSETTGLRFVKVSKEEKDAQAEV
ncbi:MAG: hypothetical protein M1830_005557 [Pleopsidium flavum]|nr:MAG: hypothetical protein M1830_005557 [Pleopsidium flavum]